MRDNCVTPFEVSVIVLRYLEQSGFAKTASTFKREAKAQFRAAGGTAPPPGVRNLLDLLNDYVQLKEAEARRAALAACNPLAARVLAALDAEAAGTAAAAGRAAAGGPLEGAYGAAAVDRPPGYGAAAAPPGQHSQPQQQEAAAAVRWVPQGFPPQQPARAYNSKQAPVAVDDDGMEAAEEEGCPGVAVGIERQQERRQHQSPCRRGLVPMQLQFAGEGLHVDTAAVAAGSAGEEAAVGSGAGHEQAQAALTPGRHRKGAPRKRRRVADAPRAASGQGAALDDGALCPPAALYDGGDVGAGDMGAGSGWASPIDLLSLPLDASGLELLLDDGPLQLAFAEHLAQRINTTALAAHPGGGGGGGSSHCGTDAAAPLTDGGRGGDAAEAAGRSIGGDSAGGGGSGSGGGGFLAELISDPQIVLAELPADPYLAGVLQQVVRPGAASPQGAAAPSRAGSLPAAAATAAVGRTSPTAAGAGRKVAPSQGAGSARRRQQGAQRQPAQQQQQHRQQEQQGRQQHGDAAAQDEHHIEEGEEEEQQQALPPVLPIVSLHPLPTQLEPRAQPAMQLRSGEGPLRHDQQQQQQVLPAEEQLQEPLPSPQELRQLQSQVQPAPAQEGQPPPAQEEQPQQAAPQQEQPPSLQQQEQVQEQEHALAVQATETAAAGGAARTQHDATLLWPATLRNGAADQLQEATAGRLPCQGQGMPGAPGASSEHSLQPSGAGRPSSAAGTAATRDAPGKVAAQAKQEQQGCGPMSQQQQQEPSPPAVQQAHQPAPPTAQHGQQQQHAQQHGLPAAQFGPPATQHGPLAAQQEQQHGPPAAQQGQLEVPPSPTQQHPGQPPVLYGQEGALPALQEHQASQQQPSQPKLEQGQMQQEAGLPAAQPACKQHQAVASAQPLLGGTRTGSESSSPPAGPLRAAPDSSRQHQQLQPSAASVAAPTGTAKLPPAGAPAGSPKLPAVVAVSSALNAKLATLGPLEQPANVDQLLQDIDDLF